MPCGRARSGLGYRAATVRSGLGSGPLGCDRNDDARYAEIAFGRNSSFSPARGRRRSTKAPTHRTPVRYTRAPPRPARPRPGRPRGACPGAGRRAGAPRRGDCARHTRPRTRDRRAGERRSRVRVHFAIPDTVIEGAAPLLRSITQYPAVVPALALLPAAPYGIVYHYRPRAAQRRRGARCKVYWLLGV